MLKTKSLNRKEWEQIGIQRGQEKRRILGLGLGPISDIFEVIEQQGILLIRYPDPSGELTAFYADIKGFPVIYINSSNVLGRQIFSAVHELCHFFYDKDNLTTFICNPGNNQEEENQYEVIADAFAGEFLVPMEGLKLFSHNYFNRSKTVTEAQVIKLQHYYKVSYAAMLYNLYKAGYMNTKMYKELKRIDLLDNAGELRRLTKRSGFSTELLEPTPPKYPQKFYDAIVNNFENELISFAKLESLLKTWNRTPEEFGLERCEL